MQTSTRILIAAATIGLAIGGAAAPFGVDPAQAAEHAKAHSTRAQQTATTPAQRAAARSEISGDTANKPGCRKYTPDSPEYRDCKAQ